jgi:threonine/homoserine/homoserine lactone efflux protein
MPVALDTWLAYAAATAVLLVIPGPTILTVISYSLTHGRRANAALVAGVALGDSTALVLSLVGLGAVLAASAVLFTAVKWAGGLYLIYLGVRMLRGGAVALPAEGEVPAQLESHGRVFLNTGSSPRSIPRASSSSLRSCRSSCGRAPMSRRSFGCSP